MATPPPMASPLSPPSRQSSLQGDNLQQQDVATRLHQMETLVEKRRVTLNYLREVLRRCYSTSQGAFVYGCVQLGRPQVTAVQEAEVPRGRSVVWLHLGLSLRKLLHKYTATAQTPQPLLNNGPLSLLRDVAQLLEELDYHHSSASAVQSVKLLLARPWPSLHPDLNPAPPPPVSSTTDLTAHLTPRLYRFNNSIVYEHLHTVGVPFPLHYPLVADCLLQSLSLLYLTLASLVPLPGHALHLHAPALDALHKVDVKLRGLVLEPLAKELNIAALHSAKHELKWLRQDHGLA